MHTDDQHRAMNQKIFSMGLSTETISVYLLCCGLTDAGSPVSTKRLLAVWNSSPESLQEGLSTLEAAGVLKKILSDGEDHTVYQLKAASRW